MKKRGIIFATISAAVVSALFSSLVLASHETLPDNSLAFSDVSNEHPNVYAIKYLKENHIIQGYPNGEFRPDFTLNRAEFTKILIAAISPNPTGKNCFKDVKEQWFAPYICTAKQKGIVQGLPDGTFQPTKNISFSEAAKIITKTFEIQAAETSGEDPWYRGFVESLETKAAIPTSIDYVSKKLSRADMTEVVWRLKTANNAKPTKTYEALVSDFPKLSSCAELKEKYLAYNYAGRWRGEKGGGGGEFAPSIAAVSTQEAETSGGDYSTTNIQVEGVDEADVVKNDEQYIYLIKGNTVRIIKTYPPEEMREISKIDLQPTDKNIYFYTKEIYIAGNQLTVIGNFNESSKSRTRTLIYDITNKETPVLQRSFDFDGNYISSRRIGNKVYLVLDYRPYTNEKDFTGEDLLPRYFDSRVKKNLRLAGCSEISFYPRYSDLGYLIVASVSLENPQKASVKSEVFMGGGTDVYSSIENLYVVRLQSEYDDLQQYNVWQPPIVETSTIIYRFALENGNITFKGQGTVPGAIVNQFSMDEYKGAFRLTTTTGDVWNTKNPSKNHLYILDADDLNKVLGKLEGLAPGERIYSTRFAGNKAYMVTFKKIDPFFVLDVSDHRNPKVLGALKIPGYSDYLHPYDENHIIGFGKQTATPTEEEIEQFNDNEFSFEWYQGIKIGLFDTTDPTHPIQKFQEIIGDRGTDSEILYNHKALLFNKARNLFGFPVSLYEIPNKQPGQYTGSSSGEFTFQGGYIYTLDLDRGFQLKGRITHQEPTVTEEEAITDPWGWFYDADNVTRIIQIRDYLYTVSNKQVKVTNLNDMTEKNSLTLEGDDYYSPQYY